MTAEDVPSLLILSAGCFGFGVLAGVVLSWLVWEQVIARAVMRARLETISRLVRLRHEPKS